jgi:DNA polymerase-4
MDKLTDHARLLTGLPFNPKPSTIMHIDLNSCFATIEQQANPLLQGKPIAVAAYATPSGCILAPSIEAKKLGVKTGMRVKEGKLLCPNLQILGPDPWKYRNIHLQLRDLIAQYTADFAPKSIDEFVLNFEGYPSFNLGLKNVGQEIKDKIKSGIGEWLTVSIGIGPNRFLAKLAAGLKKPDGLEEINIDNHQYVYSQLKLDDLNGIKRANVIRLNNAGIFNLNDFYNASVPQLKLAFHSILGYYWYLRIRGWEIDDVNFGRKSFGNMYSLSNQISEPEKLSPLLHKLVEKCSFRMRRAGFSARGVHVGLLYKDRSFWHHGSVIKSEALFNSNDIYKFAYRILSHSPYHKPVANLSVSLFDLKKSNFSQLDLFNDLTKKTHLTQALDKINEKWGDFVITPAMMIDARDKIPDRVAFGNIKELEQFICTE